MSEHNQSDEYELSTNFICCTIKYFKEQGFHTIYSILNKGPHIFVNNLQEHRRITQWVVYGPKLFCYNLCNAWSAKIQYIS